MERCKICFEEMKEKVGMAPYGSTEYYRNAAKILSQCPERADTQAKLVDLAASKDPETSVIAVRALLGYPYEEPEDDYDYIPDPEDPEDYIDD